MAGQNAPLSSFYGLDILLNSVAYSSLFLSMQLYQTKAKANFVLKERLTLKSEIVEVVVETSFGCS